MQAEPATCTRVKFFWAWDAPKEEKWLEQMARDGWLLVRGGVVFRFARGTASECRYRLDYRTETGSALHEYLNLCRDAGWEHVDRFANWHYFRCLDPAAPELHTDPESLAASYKRLLALLVGVLILNVVLFLPHATTGSARFGAFYQATEWIRFGLMGLLAYGIYRIAAFIRRLHAGGGNQCQRP